MLLGKSRVTLSGLIRSIAVSPDGSWVAVGFSSGIISLLDLNTGVMLGTWKAHDSEILQVKEFIAGMSDKLTESRREKTGFLHMRKQRRRSALR